MAACEQFDDVEDVNFYWGNVASPHPDDARTHGHGHL